MVGTNAIAGSSSNRGLWYSTNSGQSWTQSTTNTTGRFYSVYMDNLGNAIAGSASNRGLWYSTNSGQSWTQSTTNTTGSFYSVYMVGTNASAAGAGIWTSSNYGVTWTQTNVTTPIYSVFINNNLKSIAGGDYPGIYYTPEALCLNHDTKILCLNKNLEEYIAIQDLRKGDMVKSYLHGYRKIACIGKNKMINNPNYWNLCMYKMEKKEGNGLIEDLIVLGGHSLLVDEVSDEVRAKYKELNVWGTGEPIKLDDKYLLLAAVSEEFVKEENTDLYTYYQLALDGNGDDDRRFGIWANGLLIETPSKNLFHLIKWEDM
jgi:hypothetical protein